MAFAVDEDATSELQRVDELGQWRGALTPHQLEELHGLVRSPCPTVWRAACRLLGSRAQREDPAWAQVQALLAAPVPELRVRALEALRPLALERPPELRRLVLEQLEADPCDPLLLEGLLALLVPLVEVAEMRALIQAALEHREPAMRAAGAAVLPGVPGVAAEHYGPLAADPSPWVRASLASALPLPQADDDLLFPVWSALAAAQEPYLRAYVADRLLGDGAGCVEAPALARLLQPLLEDPDELVRDTAQGRPPARQPDEQPAAGFTRLQTLRAQLDGSLAQALEAVRELLAARDGLEQLHLLAHLVRRPSSALLCQVAERLLSSACEASGSRLARVPALLEQAGEDDRLAGLRALFAEAQRGLEVASVQELACWRVLSEHARHLVPLPQAAEGLQALEAVALAVQGRGISGGLMALEEEARNVREGTGGLVLEVLELVTDHWSDLLEGAVEEQMGGGEP